METYGEWLECAKLCMEYYQDGSKCREMCGDPIDPPTRAPEVVDTPDLSNNYEKPPRPPNPPPPPHPPPPPPFLPPPRVFDHCTCACTSAMQTHANAESEWSEMALIAMAAPSENTRLYTAKAAIERGSEQHWTGHVWVSGNNDQISRFLASAALSPPWPTSRTTGGSAR